MKDFTRCSRRTMLKFAAVACGYTVLGLNITKEAVAAAANFVTKRQQAVYAADANDKLYAIKKSQNNPMIELLYNKDTGFLKDGPCSHESHHLLHTHYHDRSEALSALKSRGVKLAI